MPATHTPGAVSPTAEMHQVIELMRAEGLSPHRWSNAPGDTHSPHDHSYHKVLCCLRGSIRFVLTRELHVPPL